MNMGMNQTNPAEKKRMAYLEHWEETRRFMDAELAWRIAQREGDRERAARMAKEMEYRLERTEASKQRVLAISSFMTGGREDPNQE